MKSIARDENQVTLIYSSTTRVGKRTRAHIDAIKDKELQTIDIAENPLTGTQWAEIATEMNKQIKDLISYDELTEDDELQDSDFDDNDYIKILKERPEVFVHPIAINGNTIKQIINPTEVQEFLGVDSAGLEKKMMHEDPIIDNQTKGENFINKNDGDSH